MYEGVSARKKCEEKRGRLYRVGSSQFLSSVILSYTGPVLYGFIHGGPQDSPFGWSKGGAPFSTGEQLVGFNNGCTNIKGWTEFIFSNDRIEPFLPPPLPVVH